MFLHCCSPLGHGQHVHCINHTTRMTSLALSTESNQNYSEYPHIKAGGGGECSRKRTQGPVRKMYSSCRK